MLTISLYLASMLWNIYTQQHISHLQGVIYTTTYIINNVVIDNIYVIYLFNYIYSITIYTKYL